MIMMKEFSRMADMIHLISTENQRKKERKEERKKERKKEEKNRI